MEILMTIQKKELHGKKTFLDVYNVVETKGNEK